MTKYSNQYHSLSPSLVSLINRSGPTSWIRDFFILAGAVELWSCGAGELLPFYHQPVNQQPACGEET